MQETDYYIETDSFMFLIMGGDAIEARRRVPPQISRPRGTLWNVPPQILVVASEHKGLKGATMGQHKGNFALQRLCNHGLVCRVLVNAVAMQIN